MFLANVHDATQLNDDPVTGTARGQRSPAKNSVRIAGAAPEAGGSHVRQTPGANAAIRSHAALGAILSISLRRAREQSVA